MDQNQKQPPTSTDSLDRYSPGLFLKLLDARRDGDLDREAEALRQLERLGYSVRFRGRALARTRRPASRRKAVAR